MSDKPVKPVITVHGSHMLNNVELQLVDVWWLEVDPREGDDEDAEVDADGEEEADDEQDGGDVEE